MADPIDPFDPDNFRYDGSPFHMRQQRIRDEHLQVFKTIWERLSKDDQEELKGCLHTLRLLSRRVGKLTKWLLMLPNIATNDLRETDEECIDHLDPLIETILKLKKSLYITDEEYLCAIACWEAGEVYVVAEPIPHAHPRWPYRTFLHLFDETDPEEGK